MNLKIYSIEISDGWKSEKYILAVNSIFECGPVIEAYHYKNKDFKYFPFTEEEIRNSYMCNRDGILNPHYPSIYYTFICNTTDFFKPMVLEHSNYND